MCIGRERVLRKDNSDQGVGLRQRNRQMATGIKANFGLRLQTEYPLNTPNPYPKPKGTTPAPHKVLQPLETRLGGSVTNLFLQQVVATISPSSCSGTVCQAITWLMKDIYIVHRARLYR